MCDDGDIADVLWFYGHRRPILSCRRRRQPSPSSQPPLRNQPKRPAYPLSPATSNGSGRAQDATAGTGEHLGVSKLGNSTASSAARRGAPWRQNKMGGEANMIFWILCQEHVSGATLAHTLGKLRSSWCFMRPSVPKQYWTNYLDNETHEKHLPDAIFALDP